MWISRTEINTNWKSKLGPLDGHTIPVMLTGSENMFEWTISSKIKHKRTKLVFIVMVNIQSHLFSGAYYQRWAHDLVQWQDKDKYDFKKCTVVGSVHLFTCIYFLASYGDFFNISTTFTPILNCSRIKVSMLSFQKAVNLCPFLFSLNALDSSHFLTVVCISLSECRYIAL